MIDEIAPLTLEIEGSIARIRFTQPGILNAITMPLAEALFAAAREIAAAPDVRAVLISGDGRAFMAGGDLVYLREAGKARAEGEASALILRFHEAVRRITSLPMPVLAVIHGAAAGAGLSLALACDFTIAAAGCRLVFAYSQIGASPDGGLSWSLPRMVGLRRALDIAFLNQKIGAAEAKELGLVNRVAEDAALAEASEAFVQELASLPTRAFAQTKALMRGAFERGWSDQLDAEHEAFRACTRTDDFHEGVGAFFERRPPHFQGR